MKFNRKKIGVLSLLLCAHLSLLATEEIHIAHEEGDMTPKVRKAIEMANEKDIKLVFEKATYFFKPDHAIGRYLYVTNHDNGYKKIIFLFEDFDSVTIEGNGAEFLFHGQVAPFHFENCGKVTAKDFSIDWDIPFLFQGEVTVVNKKEGWFELWPFTKGYSWTLSKGRVLFPNIDGFNFEALGTSLEWNAETNNVAYGVSGLYLRPEKVVKTQNGHLRFYDSGIGKFPVVGNILQSKGDKANDRYAPGMHLRGSNNIHISKVVIHHALGMGYLFDRCDGITVVDSGVYLKENTDRVVTTIADATHFAGCKGNVLVENCRFEGMLDDGTNVHGIYLRVNDIEDEHSLIAERMHNEHMGQVFAEEGDEVWFIHSPSPKRREVNKVSEVEEINERFVRLTFEAPLSPSLGADDVLENKTWNPVFTMRGCSISKHRARNIIIKTPEPILIENNYLSSMMSSIMLRGETYYWYESGAVRDVVIRNNHFEHCAYGGLEHAVFRVSPRLAKVFDQTETYDSNILFENNLIETFDNRIVWADRLAGFVFRNNTIKQTTTEKPQYPEAYLFDFENCKDVEISKNTYLGNVTKFVKADNASKKSLRVKANKGIRFKEKSFNK
ncbi:alpha-1,3-galactosidase-related protein [Ulvibacterium sp.]|uniref:alpha-1,3-galactosidase-related protein n=1 Tax=Ulvibacterium sp. TaxID=2665914 RepID=UPI003BAAD782